MCVFVFKLGFTDFSLRQKKYTSFSKLSLGWRDFALLESCSVMSRSLCEHVDNSSMNNMYFLSVIAGGGVWA